MPGFHSRFDQWVEGLGAEKVPGQGRVGLRLGLGLGLGLGSNAFPHADLQCIDIQRMHTNHIIGGLYIDRPMTLGAIMHIIYPPPIMYIDRPMTRHRHHIVSKQQGAVRLGTSSTCAP